MEAPKQITPTKLADYLEVLTNGAFDPEYVANLSPDDIDRLATDTRIIRNRRKIEATVHNAEVMLALDREFNGFQNYLRLQPGFDALLADMKKRFKFVGAFGAYYFLWVVREEVPPHEEFRAKLSGES